MLIEYFSVCVCKQHFNFIIYYEFIKKINYIDSNLKMYPRLVIHFSNYVLVSAMHWNLIKLLQVKFFTSCY